MEYNYNLRYNYPWNTGTYQPGNVPTCSTVTFVSPMLPKIAGNIIQHQQAGNLITQALSHHQPSVVQPAIAPTPTVHAAVTPAVPTGPISIPQPAETALFNNSQFSSNVHPNYPATGVLPFGNSVQNGNQSQNFGQS